MPWGTPNLTAASADKIPSTTAHWDMFRAHTGERDRPQPSPLVVHRWLMTV